MSKRPRQRWFLREWRKYRGLSQEKLAERVSLLTQQYEKPVALHKGDVSNLEKGKRRYNQDVLEALAEALETDPASLLMRDPTEPENIWSIWEQANEGQRATIREIAEAITHKKAG